MELKIVFANIFQGMIFAGKNEKQEHLFTGWLPSKYIEYFKQFSPDICCFAEMCLDDKEGNSNIVQKMASEYDLSYYKNLVCEKSWVLDDKYYGLSVISRFPILDYQVIKLPNPYLEVTRPNGDKWITHDKYIQKAVINIDGQTVNVLNFQGFPFHHFNRRINEDEFSSLRKGMANILLPDNNPTIITGDFNNQGTEIEKALPELFSENGVKRAVIFNDEARDCQIDHILASPHFDVLESNAVKKYSDHHALIVKLAYSHQVSRP